MIVKKIMKHLNKKAINFDEVTNERMNEIKTLIKKVNYNNFTYIILQKKIFQKDLSVLNLH